MVIAGTGPLIGLARVGDLELLRGLYGGIWVPPMVHAELAVDSGRPGANVLAGAFAAGWLKVEPVIDASGVADLARLLDQGASEAIALATEHKTRFLLIDDARGRKVARGRGLSVVGVAGVLLSAKSRGTLAGLGPVLEGLARVGYRLSPRLVAAVLDRAGE